MVTLWLAFILSIQSQEPTKPLPDAESLRSAVPGIVFALDNSLLRATIDFDSVPEAAEYTYTEKQTITTPGTREGKPRVQVNVYDMMRGPETWNFYRKQISRDGSPLTAQEMERQDRRHQAFEQSVRADLSKGDTRSESKKRQEEARIARDKQAHDNDLRAMFDIRVVAREWIDSLPVILLELNPKPNYKSKTDYGKKWKHVTIRAWITADGHEVVRLTARLGEEFGPPGFPVIEKDATISVEHRLVNERVWLPVRTEVTGRRERADGRTVATHQHVLTEFSNFKKFTIDTVIRPAGLTQ